MDFVYFLPRTSFGTCNGLQMYSNVSVLIPATTVVHIHLLLLDYLFLKYIADVKTMDSWAEI